MKTWIFLFISFLLFGISSCINIYPHHLKGIYVYEKSPDLTSGECHITQLEFQGEHTVVILTDGYYWGGTEWLCNYTIDGDYITAKPVSDESRVWIFKIKDNKTLIQERFEKGCLYKKQ